MSPEVIGYIGLGVLVIMLLSGLPVALSMGISGVFGLLVFTSAKTTAYFVAAEIYTKFTSYHLLVIPLFVWMGFLAAELGIGKGLFNLAEVWLSRVRGGLALAATAACAMFGAICGSPLATTAAIGSMGIPEMKKHGYNVPFAAATVAGAGYLGILIPPSVGAIIYSVLTEGEASITRLFVAGIPAGILLMLIYWIFILLLVNADKSLAPPGFSASWRSRLSAFRGGIAETIVVFVVVMGSLIIGLATPTEAAALGVAALVVVGLSRRLLTWRGFVDSLRKATRTGIMILLLIAMAMVFGRFFALSRIPFLLVDWVTSMGMPVIGVVIIVIAIKWVGGLFLDMVALTVLLVPIFLPLLRALEVDLVWFYFAYSIAAAIGPLTPPVCMAIYVSAGIADLPIWDVVKKAWIFILSDVLCGALILFFPWLVLALPNLLLGPAIAR